jgi:hypothetical protein
MGDDIKIYPKEKGCGFGLDSVQGPVMGRCAHNSKLSGCIKVGKFL